MYGRELGGKDHRGYGPFNWREGKVSAMVYLSAMMRHIGQFVNGQDCDGESLCHHLGHVMAGCAIVLDAAANGCLVDDRPKTGWGCGAAAELTLSDYLKTRFRMSFQ